MPNSAWGIDIGNRALKAVKLVRDGGRLRVDDFEVIEHEQILSQAGDNKESLLQTALANFVQNHNTKGIPVAVSVSGQQSFARFIKLPPVEPKKIPEIVRFEAIQQIPFPLDDVEWSYQLFQEPESPEVEVGIFAMKKDLVNKQISYFTNLGLNVTTVQMSPLAVYNGMYHDDQTGETTMFMDSGAENTDLVIADGQTVWLRTLPIGGNQFTEALAKQFKMNFQKAEELKRNAATSKYAKQIFQAMRPVFADLVAEIQRSMGFYASVHRDARIARILALGSTFQLPGLQKYLQQNLQLPVEKLDAFKALPPQDSKTAAGFSEHSITLASAYGLAVQAIGDAKITSSLLPETIRRAKMWREKTKWFAAAAAIFLLAPVSAGGAWYYHNMMYNSPTANDFRTKNQQIYSKANQRISLWKNDIEGTAETNKVRLVTIKSLADYRDLVPSIVAEVLAAAPGGDMEKLRAQKREDRQLVLIDQLGTEYHIGMTPILDPNQTDLFARLARDPVAAMGNTGGGNAALGRGGGGGAGSDEAVSDQGGGGAAANPDMPMDRGGGRSRRSFVPQPVAESAPAGDAEQRRGFIITVKGITPNKGGTRFVQDTFIKKLLANSDEAKAAAAQKPWFIARAEVVSGGKRVKAEGAGGPTPEYRGFGGRGGRGGFGQVNTPSGATLPDPDTEPELTNEVQQGGAGRSFRMDAVRGDVRAAQPAQPGQPEKTPEQLAEEARQEALKDRAFPGESIKDDTEFTAVIAVVLDPKAKQGTEEK